MHGAVGPPDVSAEVAEQVEAQRLRRQQVGPQALVVEALLALDERRAGAGGGQRRGRHEPRARGAAVVERHSATDGTDGDGGPRDDRLRADRVPVRLAPLRLVVPGAAAEHRHCGAAGDAVVGLPAVGGLQFLT